MLNADWPDQIKKTKRQKQREFYSYLFYFCLPNWIKYTSKVMMLMMVVVAAANVLIMMM